jgi:hypothetical protein
LILRRAKWAPLAIAPPTKPRGAGESGGGDDLEMEDFSQAARGLSYFVNIKTAAPTDKVIKVAQFADKRLPYGKLHAQAHAGAGKIIRNEREYAIVD